MRADAGTRSMATPHEPAFVGFVSFSGFLRRTDTRPQPTKLRWSEFAERLSAHQELLRKDGPMFSPATFKRGTTRANANVESISMLVADLDDGSNWSGTQERIEPYAYVAYTTYGSTPDHLKLRAVVPLVTPEPPGEWRALRERANEHLFLGGMDRATKAESEAYYFPACPPKALRMSTVHDGRWLDLRALPPASTPPRQASQPLPDVIYEHEGRNNWLFSLACGDRQRGLAEDEIRERLRTPNAIRCRPPLDDQELASIARSACRYEAGPHAPPLHAAGRNALQRRTAQLLAGFRGVR
jgi:hypothetical protein